MPMFSYYSSNFFDNFLINISFFSFLLASGLI